MHTSKYNIGLVGDSDVGKTTFLNFMQNGVFDEMKPAKTIGVEYLAYRRSNRNWNIWDLAGDHAFNGVTRGYYSQVDMFLLFFDVNNITSFNNLDDWINRISTNSKKDSKIILVGNKNDLQKLYSTESLNTFCNKYNIMFIEISIKNAININILLQSIENELNNSNLYFRGLKSTDKYILLEDENKNGCCCWLKRFFFKK